MRFVAARSGDDRRNRSCAKPRKTACITTSGAEKLNQGSGQDILATAAISAGRNGGLLDRPRRTACVFSAFAGLPIAQVESARETMK
jgi:hypothetical protein